jgi:hypothetical protein
MRASVTTLAIVGLLGISMPSGLDSCGPGFPPSAVFATSQRPAELNEFLSGKVGVLQRTYRQRYLIGGFRILSGIPLTETEAQPIYNFEPAADLPRNYLGYIERAGFDAWHAAREAVTKLGTAPPVEAYKTLTAPGLIESFQNCNDDAFLVAEESLSELSAAWGTEDSKTLDWVRAQDRVFANCSGAEPVIPEPPQADADPLFAAYRRYQIAAALLYSGQYHKASAAFEQISKDGQSPWRGYGPYLAARALVRAGTVDHDQEALNEGRGRLLAISNDPEQGDWHDPSLRLLHLWQIRGEPAARLAELGRELMKPTDDADVGQSVYDFLYLLNKRQGKTQRQRPQRELAEVENSGELAAWLLSMSPDPPADAGERSAGWWRKSRNPAWLISALLNAPDTDLPELLAAAKQIPPTASAYESATHYAISREIGQGQRQEARLWADRALTHNLQRSSRNLILAQRTTLARSWKEFLHFGLRRPEPHILLDNNEGNEEYVGVPPDTTPMFDLDVTESFNGAQLSVWMDASENMELPAYMRLQIDEAGWLRAVLLGKDDESRKLMERAVTLQPTSTAVARGFLSARDHEEVKFAAIHLVLRNPALSPQFGGGAHPVDLANAHYLNGRVCWAVGGVISKDLRFLTADELVAATTESKKLRDAERWDATYLARQTVEWTQKHPDDPRVPEALHRAVMASRYRCTDENTGKYSKQAFDLLHRQYPKSAWAARTPYWYK